MCVQTLLLPVCFGQQSCGTSAACTGQFGKQYHWNTWAPVIQTATCSSSAMENMNLFSPSCPARRVLHKSSRIKCSRCCPVPPAPSAANMHVNRCDRGEGHWY